MSMGTPAQIYLLELEMFDDSDEEARQIIFGVLRRITGQDFGTDVSKWAEWIGIHMNLWESGLEEIESCDKDSAVAKGDG